MEYETACPECGKKIVINVDEYFIEQCAMDITIDRREAKTEARD